MKKALMAVIMMMGVLLVGGNLYAGDIIADGNVGVGTTSPQRPLQVYGATATIGQKTTLDDLGWSHYISPANGSFNIHEYLDPEWSSGATRMTITRGGNVGIGTTSPQRPLQVYGATATIGQRTTLDGLGWSHWINPANGNFNIQEYLSSDWTSSATRMTIERGGNVGIGTTDPQEKLEVAGNMKVSGTISGATYGYGGMYTYNAVTPSCVSANPFTNDCTCPADFLTQTLLTVNDDVIYSCYKK